MEKTFDARTIYGHTAIQLKMSCPKSRIENSPDCLYKVRAWVWVDCGHNVFADDGGDLWCLPELCNKSHFIKDVGFKCNDQKHGTEYVKFTHSNMIAAISDYANAVNLSNLSEKIKGNFS
jgi:hypothetical protein